MTPINKDVLKKAANKLMFEMSEQEYETLLLEFNVIQKQMELLANIPNVDEAEPMTFPFDVTNSFLREDIPSKQLAREDALKNAGDVVEGQIRLPKVVG